MAANHMRSQNDLQIDTRKSAVKQNDSILMHDYDGQAKLNGSVVRKKTFHYGGKCSGRTTISIFALLLSFMVSAYGIEVLDGHKIVDEIKEIILRNRLLDYEELQREFTVVKGMIGILIFSAIFGVVFILKGWKISSQTECGQLVDKTEDEKINSRLSYSPSSLIGIGSHGSSVYTGTYNGIAVAIKRVLNTHHSIVENEMQHLLSAEKEYIVQYHGYEKDIHFTYIAVQKCACNLKEFIEVLSNPNTSERKSEFLSVLKDNFHLWERNGDPSINLISLIENIVFGLLHLHTNANKIVHRDLKPGNVLILFANNDPIPKLSGMGMSKHLVGQSSVSRHLIDYGSSGWRAPELILNGQHDTPVDMFSLGCLIFFCVTKGDHPFGLPSKRDANIVNNKPELSIIIDIPEAYDLVSKLINHTPHKRLDVCQTLHHPFFWDSSTKMDFIACVSNAINSEGANSRLRRLVENVASKVFSQNWASMIDQGIVNFYQGYNSLQGYRQYNYSSLSALLSLMRNSNSHFQELAKGVDLRRIVGNPTSENLYSYFFQQYRLLLMEVYGVICQTHPYNVDPEFQKFVEI